MYWEIRVLEWVLRDYKCLGVLGDYEYWDIIRVLGDYESLGILGSLSLGVLDIIILYWEITSTWCIGIIIIRCIG